MKELWVAFGQSGKRRWLPIHKLVEKLGAERCKRFPFFHAFTGCDMVSGCKGKITFFQVWNNFSDATDAFVLLSNCPTEQALENTFATVQKFTVLAYDKSSNKTKVDKVRKTPFTQKNKTYDAIHPTEDSLKQHCLRAAYQAGYVWGQALKP